MTPETDIERELESLRQSIEAEPAPPLRLSRDDLLADAASQPRLAAAHRRRTIWQVGLAAAATVALAIVLAQELVGPGTVSAPPATAVASLPAPAPADTYEFELPTVTPAMPQLSTPNMSGSWGNVTFSIPSFAWPNPAQASATEKGA